MLIGRRGQNCSGKRDCVPSSSKFPNVWQEIIGDKICPNWLLIIQLKNSQSVDI
jgi:hypothetical protein